MVEYIPMLLTIIICLCSISVFISLAVLVAVIVYFSRNKNTSYLQPTFPVQDQPQFSQSAPTSAHKKNKDIDLLEIQERLDISRANRVRDDEEGVRVSDGDFCAETDVGEEDRTAINKLKKLRNL